MVATFITMYIQTETICKRKKKKRTRKRKRNKKEMKIIEDKYDSKLSWKILCNTFSKRKSTAIEF